MGLTPTPSSTRYRVLACAAVVWAAGVASHAGEGRRGPLEIREEWLLAQARLTLPAVSPDPLPRGETRLSVELDWGNDFGLEERAYAPDGIGLLVDGEHRTTALDLRRGLTSSLTVGARIPLRWRGPGVLDGLIDAWHHRTGTSDNRRSYFPNRRMRVEGRDDALRPLAWRGSRGGGLGDVELLAHWAFRRPREGGWAAAVVGRATLPTGSGPFDAAGIDAGAQLVAAHPLGGRADVYLGLGGTLFGDLERDGRGYAPRRAHGFLAFEWRPTRRTSLLIETSAASRLLAGVPAYADRHVYLRAGIKREVHDAWVLQVGIVEGLASLQSTTDFGVFFGISRTLPPAGR